MIKYSYKRITVTKGEVLYEAEEKCKNIRFFKVDVCIQQWNVSVEFGVYGYFSGYYRTERDKFL